MGKLLHIASRKPNERVWVPDFLAALERIGDLALVEDGDDLTDAACAELIRQCDVLITCWQSLPVPRSLAEDRGRLRYICNVTGSVRQSVPIELVEAGIPLTNWGDAPAGRLAEGAMTLLLAAVKNLRLRIETASAGGGALPGDAFSGTLEGMQVGVYGCGAIGRRFVEMLRPFEPVIRVYDPYVDGLPPGCLRSDSLPELFRESQAIVIHAGLSDETGGSVTAELLAMLPDNGIVINTARGAIIDQTALFSELESGRLLAGLDVLHPDKLAADHPARKWPNLILTSHNIGKAFAEGTVRPRGLQKMHRRCLENLERFFAGEPLEFAMDRDRYLRST